MVLHSINILVPLSAVRLTVFPIYVAKYEILIHGRKYLFWLGSLICTNLHGISIFFSQGQKFFKGGYLLPKMQYKEGEHFDDYSTLGRTSHSKVGV